MNMKNKLFLIIATVSLVSLTGCFNDPGTDVLFEANDSFVELDAATVGGKSYLYERLNNGTTYAAGFEVAFAGASNTSGVSVTFEIDASSTAIENVHYTVSGSTVTIPSGSFTAALPITILADGIEAGEKLTIVVNITASDVPVNPNFATGTHTIQITCPSDLAGTYSMTSVGTEYYGSAFTYTFDDTYEEVAPGAYKISDLSGGMEPNIWSNDPVEAILIDVCGVISLDEANFDYIYDYDVLSGSVDPATGVITVSWQNTYGENGVNTYTPK
jgi:hypothetical protein